MRKSFQIHIFRKPKARSAMIPHRYRRFPIHISPGCQRYSILWGGAGNPILCSLPLGPWSPDELRHMIKILSCSISSYIFQAKKYTGETKPSYAEISPPKNRLPDNYLLLSGAWSSGRDAGRAAGTPAFNSQLTASNSSHPGFRGRIITLLHLPPSVGW